MTVRGTVDDIIFRNDENGYTVAVIDCSGAPLTVVGYFPAIGEGEVVECEGKYILNTKYGEQFAADTVKTLRPQTVEGITRFLASGLIKGVGPVTAAAIAARFGADTFDIIETDFLRLTAVKGISKDKARAIYDSLESVRGMRQAMMFLNKLSITQNLANKIYSAYGAGCESAITHNPYRLCDDVDGIGFIKADRIAATLGVSKDSEFRLGAGIRYTLETAAERNGHTCLPIKDLISSASNLLDISEENIENALEPFAVGGLIKFCDKGGEKFAALSKLYVTEKKISERLIKLRDGADAVPEATETLIDEFQKANAIEFHPAQREAIIKAFSSGVHIITGGPGTGKTTIINCVMYILKTLGAEALLTAPTGRAAKRLSEATGREAMTIHRALGYGQGGGREFIYNETNNLEFFYIIVDEVSMVDVYLAWSLLRAVRQGTRIIFVGDKDQLPSVSAGNFLADILRSGLFGVTCLTRIYRQSKGLLIDNAHRINSGEMPEFDNGAGSDFFFIAAETQEEARDTVVSLATERLPKYLGVNPYNIQVLSPVKNGLSGVFNLNRELQSRLNPPYSCKREYGADGSVFRTGDKVMQTANNYNLKWLRFAEFGAVLEGEGVFNGDIGVITDINPGVDITVRLEDGREAAYNAEDVQELAPAFAITVHKSQGCEFDAVIFPVISDNYMLMTRNLLYTAVTRAKKIAVIVGSRYRLKRMIENKHTAARHTMLYELLQSAEKNFGILDFE